LYLYGYLNNFLILIILRTLTKYLFDTSSNNQNYLKNILRKSCTKSSGIFLELQKFKDVLEEEENFSLGT